MRQSRQTIEVTSPPVLASYGTREFRVLAVVEVKDKHLSWAALGLESALVSRGRGVELVRAFGEILLLFLVILADEEAAILECDGENNIGAECVLANESIKLIGRQRDALVLLQLGQRRQLVIGRVAVPVEGRRTGQRFSKKATMNCR